MFIIMVNQNGNTTLINKQMKKAASRHPEAFFISSKIVRKTASQLNFYTYIFIYFILFILILYLFDLNVYFLYLCYDISFSSD